jgi:hypothetical protein
MRFSRVTLVIALLLAVAGAARATAPTCGQPSRTGLCSGGGQAGVKRTWDNGSLSCVGAPTDCLASSYSGGDLP